MGAMAFFILMVMMLGTGIFVFLIGLILFIIYKKKKEKAKRPKLRRNIAIAFLCMGLTVCAVPIGWLIFIRTGNGIVDEDFIDTGIWVQWENGNSFTYKGEKYVEMEYPAEVFWYDVNSEVINELQEQYEAEFNTYRSSFWNKLFNDEEEDVMYKMESGTGETLYYNGSFYCREKVVDKVEQYYADDDNYEWYFSSYDESEDVEINSLIEITEEEREDLYNIEKLQKEKSIFVDDVLEYGDIVKISKDNLIRASLLLVKHENVWYWDTEIVDDSKEEGDWWATYIQELPDTLRKKIDDLEKGMNK